MTREQVTHCEAYRAARTLFDYCNGRMCRRCIFAERIPISSDLEQYDCQFKHIIPNGMGEEELPTALLVAKENIGILRRKGRGE